MKRKLLWPILFLCALLTTHVVQAQKNQLSNQSIWLEFDCMLNPIYISQFGSHYKLNNKRLDVTPTPRFYSVQPGQIPFSNAHEILDQSNALYVNFRIRRLEKTKLLHNTRYIVGFTHDKLQTGSDTIHYKYDNGGTELTFMIDRNLTQRLSELNFERIGLVFSVNVQAGVFFSLAKIQTDIRTPGQTIVSTNTKRWQLPNPNTGWGIIGSANMEIGKIIFNRLALTVGSKLMLEGLYSSDNVSINGIKGSKLKVSNYGIFFCGPVLNLKYLIH